MITCCSFYQVFLLMFRGLIWSFLPSVSLIRVSIDVWFSFFFLHFLKLVLLLFRVEEKVFCYLPLHFLSILSVVTPIFSAGSLKFSFELVHFVHLRLRFALLIGSSIEINFAVFQFWSCFCLSWHFFLINCFIFITKIVTFNFLPIFSKICPPSTECEFTKFPLGGGVVLSQVFFFSSFSLKHFPSLSPLPLFLLLNNSNFLMYDFR